MSQRERLLMDSGWKFFRGDIHLPKGHSGWMKSGYFNMPPIEPTFDDSSWRSVNLPHDFIVEGNITQGLDPDATAASTGIAGMVAGQSVYTSHGSLPLGIGWYRKSFFVPTSDIGRKLVLEFDGIARNSQVFLNRHYVDRHLSGYTGLRYDITDIVEYGRVNVIAVRVEATEYEGWFYEGGGIYRHAWLTKHSPVHIAADGVFVTSDVNVAQKRATVSANVEIKNDANVGSVCRIGVKLIDPAGKVVASASMSANVETASTKTFVQKFEVAGAKLWSVETPSLYKAVVTLEAGKMNDEVEAIFGIRSMRFDADKGFFLNNERVALKGVCCHQDHGGIGSALPDAIQEYRIRRLKEMGCNAYRCSHNPPTPELLDVCDRLGMLVMDENRLLSSTPEGLEQLESLVKRDRNHPCVFIWSLANEEPLQGSDMGARIADTMKRLVRKLDPTRLTTMAMNSGWGEGLSAVVDVQGCNYITNGNIDEIHKKFPKQPIVYTESCSTLSTRGIYVKDTQRGYVSAYDNNVPMWGSTSEDNWLFCLKRPFISGTFVWTGFDYRGEPTPYGWPCISSHFGIMDMCGFAKDNFYYYQAWWSDKTVLHVLPHWNWQGKEGQKIDVWVHSNCDEVELSLNGKSLGKKRVKTARHLEWKVAYKSGELMARGWKDGWRVKTTKVQTTGPAAGIKFMPDRTQLNADGEDTTVVNVAVVDSKGRVVPTAENEIVFRVGGNGKLLGIGNGDPSSHEPDKATRRRVFNGLCQLVIQATGDAGEIRIDTESPGLATGNVTLKTVSAAVRRGVEAAIARRLQDFECTDLQKAPKDVKSAAKPSSKLSWSRVTTIQPGIAFCDIREFHGGKDGLLYIRASYRCDNAQLGKFLFGADGPVKVWINGKEAGCHPEATNPSIDAQFSAKVNWRKGANEIMFALMSNHGKAWGVYATAGTGKWD